MVCLTLVALVATAVWVYHLPRPEPEPPTPPVSAPRHPEWPEDAFAPGELPAR